MTKTYTSIVQKNPANDEYFILLPDELTETLSWKIGDELHYELKNDKIIISNISKEKITNL